MQIDAYVVDVLMRDLVGHDHSPSAFFVYLHLWSVTIGCGQKTVKASHLQIAEAIGISKSAVQASVRLLRGRGLLGAVRRYSTDTPEYTVLRPWKRKYPR